MSQVIVDGTGTGNVMEVDPQHRAAVLADERPELYALNLAGRMFVAPFAGVTPTGGSSIFLWLGNTTQWNLRVARVDVYCGSLEAVEIHTDAVPASISNGLVGTLVSMNTIGQFALAPSTVATIVGQTVNFLVTASALTGPGAGSIVGYAAIAANTANLWTPPSPLIVSPGFALYLKTQVGGHALTGAIYFAVDQT